MIPLLLNLGVDRYVLAACHRHAERTVALCSPEPWNFGPTVPADRVDLIRTDDTSSPEAALASLHRAGLGRAGFSALHCSDEFSLVTAGLLAQHLGCPGIDPVVALRFRDKALQKAAVRAAGVPTADVTFIEDISDIPSLPEVAGPSVLKPVAYGGTGFTAVVRSRTELVAAVADLRRRPSPQTGFIVESFSDGDEWVADGIAFEGQVMFLSLSRYGEPCIDALTGHRPLWAYTVDPDDDPGAYHSFRPVVKASLDALGMRSGVFHMELFRDDSGAVRFGECAARRGGGLTQEQVLWKFNVDLAEAGVLIAMGQRPDLTVKVRPGQVGHTHVLPQPGLLLSYPSSAEVEGLAGVEYARYEVPFATPIPRVFDFIGQSLGLVLLSAPDLSELVTRRDAALKFIADGSEVLPDGQNFREHRRWHEKRMPGHEALGGRLFRPVAQP